MFKLIYTIVLLTALLTISWADENTEQTKDINSKQYYEGELLKMFHTNNTAEIFKNYLSETIPSDVQLIEGQKINWLDAPTYLIFTSNKSTFDQLKSNYTLTTIQEISSTLENFPDGKISQIPNLVCYKDSSKNSAWPYVLCRDEVTSTVYFAK